MCITLRRFLRFSNNQICKVPPIYKQIKKEASNLMDKPLFRKPYISRAQKFPRLNERKSSVVSTQVGNYSARTNCTLQSIHNTLMFFVALKLLPQHGHIYFLVLLGFLIFFGASAPFPLFVPPTGAMFPKDFLKIKMSSNP